MNTVLRMSDALLLHSRGTIRHRLATGAWQQPCRGVVVLHNGALSRREQLDVALVSASPRAALAGPTALAVDRFDGFGSDTIHLVLPEGARRPSLDGLVLHWSTRLDDVDVHPARTPRRTRPARSLVDFASWTSSERHARAIIIAGVQQGLASTRQLRLAIGRRGPCRRRALIIESVLDAVGGIQSLPERDFGEICRAVGLPRPSRQVPRLGKDGRYYLDVAWLELGIAVEIHGIPHRAVMRWSDDLVRANEIVIGGDSLLVFSSYAVRHQKPAIADQLERMARAKGWDGSTNPDALRLLGQPKRINFRLQRRAS